MCLDFWRKGIAGWLIAVLLLVGSLPAGAAWQCVSGAPCPPHCMALQRAEHSASCAMMASMPHCCRCNMSAEAALSSSNLGAGSVLRTSCDSSQCVLRIQDKTAAALMTSASAVLDFYALPASTERIYTPADPDAEFSYPHPLVLYEQHQHWRPYLGRAPPTLL